MDLVAVGAPVQVAVEVAVLIAVGSLVMVVEAVAVGVNLGATIKFSRMGALELNVGVTPIAMSNRRTNIMIRIQRFVNLFLYGGDCGISVVTVIGCTSRGKQNWSVLSLSSSPINIEAIKESCQVL